MFSCLPKLFRSRGGRKNYHMKKEIIIRKIKGSEGKRSFVNIPKGLYLNTKGRGVKLTLKRSVEVINKNKSYSSTNFNILKYNLFTQQDNEQIDTQSTQ